MKSKLMIITAALTLVAAAAMAQTLQADDPVSEIEAAWLAEQPPAPLLPDTEEAMGERAPAWLSGLVDLTACDVSAQLGGCVPYCDDCGVDQNCCGCGDCGPGTCSEVPTCWAGTSGGPTGTACLTEDPQYVCVWFGGHVAPEGTDYCNCGFHSCA